MGEKISNQADRLSQLMDIQEIIVEAIAEEFELPEATLNDLFLVSEVAKKLYEPNSNYYNCGWQNIMIDFVTELKQMNRI